MKGVQCYELFGGIALINHAFLFLFSFSLYLRMNFHIDFGVTESPLFVFFLYV